MRALIIVILSINFYAYANDPVLESELHVVTNEIQVVDHSWKNERAIAVGTVVKRRADKDPHWWSNGVALEVPQDNGWKIVYTAKSNWEEGLREKNVTEFVDPEQAFKTVEDAVAAVVSEDCHNTEEKLEEAPALYSSEREKELMSKIKPVKSSFNDIMDIVVKSKTPSECFSKVRNYIKDDSPWSSLTIRERAELMDIKSKATFNMIVKDGAMTQETQEFERFQNLCKDKVLEKEAARVKIYAHSASDAAVSSVIKKYLSKIGSNSDRIWVNNLGDLYDEVAPQIPSALKKKVIANLNIDEVGKEIIKEKLEALEFPTREEMVAAFKRKYRGWSNLSSRDVKNFIGEYVTSAFLPFVKEHIDQVSTEIEKKLSSDEVTKKYKSIKRHGQYCFQLLGEMYNDGDTTISLEAINALEPILTPGLPVEDNTRPMLNPHVFHKDLNAKVAMCIARTETGVDGLNPNSINYTYCGNVGTSPGSRNYSPSTAQGFDHTVVSTINGLRKKGVLPMSTLPEARELDPKNYLDNKKINEYKADNIEAQFELSLRHMNYLMKQGHTKKTRNMKLSGRIPASVEIAIIHYDQDNQSDYVRTFSNCYKCMAEDVKNGKKTVEDCMVPRYSRFR